MGFQHTAARRRLADKERKRVNQVVFQHTAARRRLVGSVVRENIRHHVSTHSRPKAAGWIASAIASLGRGFNTQPPEGGWILKLKFFFAS